MKGGGVQRLPLRPILSKIIPLGLVVGASMELFMIKTGFYEIVTKNEAERRLAATLQKSGVDNNSNENV